MPPDARMTECQYPRNMHNDEQDALIKVWRCNQRTVRIFVQTHICVAFNYASPRRDGDLAQFFAFWPGGDC